MEISKVNTAVKMGDFMKRDDHKKYKIDFEFLENISPEIKKDRIGRVYYIVVNNIIKKIGGSASKDGIKSTIKFYTEFGRANSNRFALHYLIRKELDSNNKVEVWMTTSPKAPGKISGLYSIDNGLVAAYMEMEEKCKNEYKESENKFPDWNFKENNEKTPKEEMQKYAKHIKEYSDSYDEDDDEENEDEG